MTPLVDFGDLALGTLALISGLLSAKAARIYFWALGFWYGIDVMMFFTSHFNTLSLLVNAGGNIPPHFVISDAAFGLQSM
jgi:hypothetical protein